MNKIETNKLNQLDITILNKSNVFVGGLTGEIIWLNTNPIKFDVPMNKQYLHFSYNMTHNNSKVVNGFDYKINLLTTPCYFGGFRYWFECPIIKDDAQCKRRVGILYQYEGMFGCRHCHNLTYSIRNFNGIDKIFGHIHKRLKSIEPNKYFYYKGKPTKRYSRYIKNETRADNVYKRCVLLLNKKIERVMNPKKD